MIVRDSDENFSVSSWVFDVSATGQKLCPFEHLAPTGVTMQSEFVSGTLTNLTTNVDLFTQDYIGIRVRLWGGEVQITQITDAKHAVGTICKNLSSNAATTDWTEEAFSAVHGYPCCVTFYQGRIFRTSFGFQKVLPL